MTFVLEVFMNIIIVGCGKVGYTLVEQLGGENHNITVIDTNEEKVNSITDDLDAMGIVGNGVSFQTLSEAGIDHADLLIAVTGSDEQNLLCCVIAKRRDIVRPSPVSAILSTIMRLLFCGKSWGLP